MSMTVKHSTAQHLTWSSQKGFMRHSVITCILEVKTLSLDHLNLKNQVFLTLKSPLWHLRVEEMPREEIIAVSYFCLIISFENFIYEVCISITLNLPLPSVPPMSLQINDLFFNYCSLYIHTYTYTYMCVYEPTELCSYVHVFRTDHLRLDNLCGSFSLEEMDSPYQ